MKQKNLILSQANLFHLSDADTSELNSSYVQNITTSEEQYVISYQVVIDKDKYASLINICLNNYTKYAEMPEYKEEDIYILMLRNEPVGIAMSNGNELYMMSAKEYNRDINYTEYLKHIPHTWFYGRPGWSKKLNGYTVKAYIYKRNDI